MTNIDDMLLMAMSNRTTGLPVNVSANNDESLAFPAEDGQATSTERPPLRIDIKGVGQPSEPEEVGPAPPEKDLIGIATQMAAGAEPEGATPMSMGEFATSVADVPAALAKGIVQGTVGAPADIYSLGRAVFSAANPNPGETRLQAFIRSIGDPVEVLGYDITTEGIKKIIDGTIGPLVPEGAGARRTEAAGTAETTGEIFALGRMAKEIAVGMAKGVQRVGEAANIAGDKAVQAITGNPQATAMGVLEEAGQMSPLSRIVPGVQPQTKLVLPGTTPQQAKTISKIVDDGIAKGMSATKILQSIEARTAQKPNTKQTAAIKQYVFDKTPKGKIYSDQAFKDLIATPFPMEPSTQNFTSSFNAAMEFLSGLDAKGLKTAVQDANARLAPILGTSSQGKVNRLLTTNGKLLKTEKGVEGKTPIELLDGRNIESAGLAISPAFKAGKYSTCPNSASCERECLGKTSGGYFAYGGGADLDAMKGTRLRSFRMTQAMFREPEAFAIKVHNEIISLKRAAEKRGNALAIRLNVLSDIDPKVHEAIIKAHPDVFFYDYTKMKYKPIAPNHHYTYSSTGTSQKAGYNGMALDVDNPHTNWDQMKDRLDLGDNVAMAFSSKKALPETVLDEATGKVYRVIDGDAYDFRPMDKQPPGVDGVIIGLKNKAMTRKESAAVQDSSGFFVPYDPQFVKDGKKLRRDEFGAPIPGNTQVVVPSVQKKKTIGIAVEGKPSAIDTGEQITERTRR
jgi:hypothetical protein